MDYDLNADLIDAQQTTVSPISGSEWENRHGHRAAVLWFTGLSGSGKSTLGTMVARILFDRGTHVFVLDGDMIRSGLCSDLGFSDADRSENIRRAAYIAQVLFTQGSIVICTFITPFQADRAFARSLFPVGRFFEIYVRCSIDECRRRDPKGLYKKADQGLVRNVTGISSAYEVPLEPEIICDTEQTGAIACCERIVRYCIAQGILDNI